LTKIFLVRHAEAEGNIYRRAHGGFNGLVTGRGYIQIEQLRERFNDEHIDAVYSSDLFRAYTTAGAVSEPRGLTINKTEMLREVCMGVWEDTAWGNIEYFDSEMGDKFSHDPAQWSIKGSEPYENVQNRMVSFITETARRHDGETIAFFSHGFAIRAFMCLLNNIPSHRTDEMPYCDNTAVALMIFDNNKLELEYHSCNSHLSNELSTLAHQTWWRKDVGTGRKWDNENVRIIPLDAVSDAVLIKSVEAEAGERPAADREYAAYIGGEPAGIIGIDINRESSDNTGWISYLHVRQQLRRKTYGTQLLGQAVSDFRKLRRDTLKVGIAPDDPAVEFFKRYKFDIIHESENRIIMEKSLINW